MDIELSRVVAGIDTESMVALPSHVADLDSALRLFQSRPRLLPLGHRRRIEAAEEAIDLLQKADSVGDTASRLHDLPSELTGFLKRECMGAQMELAVDVEGLRRFASLNQGGDRAYTQALKLASPLLHEEDNGARFEELQKAGAEALARLNESQRLLKEAQEVHGLAERANVLEVKIAYLVVAKNNLLRALYDREGGPGWAMPPFPVFDLGKEDKTCSASAGPQ